MAHGRTLTRASAAPAAVDGRGAGLRRAVSRQRREVPLDDRRGPPASAIAARAARPSPSTPRRRRSPATASARAIASYADGRVPVLDPVAAALDDLDAPPGVEQGGLGAPEDGVDARAQPLAARPVGGGPPGASARPRRGPSRSARRPGRASGPPPPAGPSSGCTGRRRAARCRISARARAAGEGSARGSPSCAGRVRVGGREDAGDGARAAVARSAPRGGPLVAQDPAAVAASSVSRSARIAGSDSSRSRSAAMALAVATWSRR